jgi:SAM-dependent methyltransferase
VTADGRAAADATTRFSDRVSQYVQYRPGYPAAVIELLRERCDLGPDKVVADVGAGTGIMTRLLLAAGATVHAIEPNAEMRAAADCASAGAVGYHSGDGSGEATALPDSAVDLVVAAQAFHWLDVDRARLEWRRILRADGWAALIWNNRDVRSTPFLREYDALLHEVGTDYTRVNHQQLDDDTYDRFFGDNGWQRFTFPNVQHFDCDGLLGRSFSSSYTPGPDHPRHGAMAAALRTLFARHQTGGRVAFRYATEVYLGQL